MIMQHNPFSYIFDDQLESPNCFSFVTCVGGFIKSCPVIFIIVKLSPCINMILLFGFLKKPID